MVENDVTFAALDDRDTSRQWRLDLFPLLLEPDEWSAIERGVVQRTLLLNRLLGDLYGAQRVLKDRLLPPGLVYGNTQFLRPCTSIAVRDDLHLNFVAYDLARAADGRWWVVSDRTQAPSGAGYALENRVVSSQCLPELFAQRNVRRLASFFRAFSERFLSLSPRDQPQAVFLSPGPSKQNYFEHAYLARYLGFSFVEGSDLTVRDDRVYLKTVEGLKPRRPHHAPHRLRALRSARAAHGLARSACRGCCRRRAPARSRSAMRSGPASSRAIRS